MQNFHISTLHPSFRMLLFAPCANSNCIFCSQLRRRNHTREHPALLNYSAVPLFGTNIPDMSVCSSFKSPIFFSIPPAYPEGSRLFRPPGGMESGSRSDCGRPRLRRPERTCAFFLSSQQFFCRFLRKSSSSRTGS